MFGAGEPRLYRLDEAHAARVRAVRAEIDPAALRACLEALPAPRVRHHRPAVMATVDRCSSTGSAAPDGRQTSEPSRCPAIGHLGTALRGVHHRLSDTPGTLDDRLASVIAATVVAIERLCV